MKKYKFEQRYEAIAEIEFDSSVKLDCINNGNVNLLCCNEDCADSLEKHLVESFPEAQIIRVDNTWISVAYPGKIAITSRKLTFYLRVNCWSE